MTGPNVRFKTHPNREAIKKGDTNAFRFIIFSQLRKLISFLKISED